MVVASLVLRLLPAALLQAAVIAYVWPTLIGEATAIGLGWLLVMTGYFATAAVMWRLQPPVPTAYTDYGTAFLVGSSLVAMSVS